MLLLVYEYLTGGGLWSESVPDVDQHPLLAEGRCMVQAICEDLSRVPGARLVQLCDARLTDSVALAGQSIEISSWREESEQLAHWSARADGTLLIAPEHDGRLLRRCDIVQSAAGQLLSPNSTFVRLTSDKHATAQHLASAGIPTPDAMLLNSLTCSPPFPLPPSPTLPRSQSPPRSSLLTYPVVLKPVDGVGSLDTFRIDSPTQWCAVADRLGDGHSRPWRLERYHSGTSVSVAAFCGPRGNSLLPPCHQRIADDDRFTYHGGSYPLDTALTRRACHLARRALSALPPARGYVGVDMILGDDASSLHDVVLDVNPRLTTSYVGLRRAASTNLAEAMLAIGQGQAHPLFFRPEQVEFDCRGCVQRG